MDLRIPILVYHSVSRSPQGWIAPFAVTPEMLASHLDAIAEAEATTMTVSTFAGLLGTPPDRWPHRPVVVTFDDGFADFATVVHPATVARRIAVTLYATTGYLETATGPDGARMLDWSTLVELQRRGVEVGAHSHTHPQLDTLTRERAGHEITHSKALLEDRLGAPVRSFAYPHGYSSRTVRELVRTAGFDSACAVGDAFSHPRDDVLRLARIMVRCTTTAGDVARWVRGAGAPVAPRHERWRTRAWRGYRRAGVRVGVRREREA